VRRPSRSPLPRDPLGLPLLEQRITPADIAAWQRQLSEEEIYVHLPRFRIKSNFNMIREGSLQALGMIRALSRSAQFPGIVPYADWFSIQRFVHKSFLEVNEEGSEAAAVTVGGCFPAGTPVLTPGGPVPIEAIGPGTAVYALELNGGEWIAAEVAELRSWSFAGQMVTIRADGEEIAATWNQPFLVASGSDLESRRVPMDLPQGEAVSTTQGRWVEARDIRSGDVLVVKNGGNSVVSSTDIRTETGEVYFLEIEGYHNYAVGLRGFLVHNEKQSEEPSSFEADHPFLFLIYERGSGTILFVGRFVRPE